MRLGVGSHNVKAFVQGTTRTAATVPNAAPPRSPSESTAQLVTVKSAGTIPTATSLTANGKTGIFRLSSTVTTPARPIAGGSITFHDVANGDTALGVVPLNAGTSSLQLTPKSVPGGPSQIFESVSGDFNNDGIPDLAITYFEQTFLTILLGKGTARLRPRRML